MDLLKSWGLKAVLGKSIEAEEHQFAGDEAIRATDLQAMMDNPEIKAIWCARGGYGTVRIIDRLDFSEFIKNPKWVIGYSDVTVLHAHLHNLGVESLHAQMPVQIETKSSESAQSIREVLFGENYQVEFKNNHKLNRTGSAKGQLVGGNLSILYSLCGSPSAIKTNGKILFIEDLDEYLYHIDRMMQNLKRNGMLDNLAAMIIGGMNDMNDNAIPFGKDAKSIILDAVEEYDYPVYFDFPAGHVEDNRALVIGREVSLEFDENRVTLAFASH